MFSLPMARSWPFCVTNFEGVKDPTTVRPRDAVPVTKAFMVPLAFFATTCEGVFTAALAATGVPSASVTDSRATTRVRGRPKRPPRNRFMVSGSLRWAADPSPAAIIAGCPGHTRGNGVNRRNLSYRRYGEPCSRSSAERGSAQEPEGTFTSA